MTGSAEPLPPGGLTSWAGGSGSAYFLDVDGTLLEIEPRPEDVAADASLRGLLHRLQTEAGGALALVSGRKIADVDRIFAPLLFPCAGLHGAEIRFPDGTRTEPARGVMEPARSRCQQFVAANPGAMLEDKGATLAVHFRQRPDLASDVLALLGPFARNGLVVQEGKMVAELREARYSKGTAIEALLANAPFAGRMPIFIGDDVTDESGFRLVNATGGISIRVGPPDVATQARFRVDDPAHLRRELGLLVAAG